ncbi:hypothetical protein [Lichenifustis flavocetrariae]|uniref:Uncharacterized protein n=1 Tax=Lichenifustis flavocetrariae TaxID=2949735 RepID=A0AA41Z5J6_9HYPH|nr:hypothetical protein [Lichenifustis flavocetrariae]MCW6513185.1 hypothetical protein [Lichenifustis flavocetrariae]
MTRHMPPVPPANHSPKGTGSDPKTDRDTSTHHRQAGNTAERGETANVEQNTTNEGYFAGRRVK